MKVSTLRLAIATFYLLSLLCIKKSPETETVISLEKRMKRIEAEPTAWEAWTGAYSGAIYCRKRLHGWGIPLGCVEQPGPTGHAPRPGRGGVRCGGTRAGPGRRSALAAAPRVAGGVAEEEHLSPWGPIPENPHESNGNQNEINGNLYEINMKSYEII